MQRTEEKDTDGLLKIEKNNIKAWCEVSEPAVSFGLMLNFLHVI